MINLNKEKNTFESKCNSLKLFQKFNLNPYKNNKNNFVFNIK